MKKLFLSVLLLSGWAQAVAPHISPERIDAMVNFLSPTPSAEMKEKVKHTLQRSEFLKQQGLSVGVDKQADTKALLENAIAEVYANQFVKKLQRDVAVSEQELQQAYRRLTRKIGLQQVYFNNENKAKEALNLLKKGLSFEDLMKRYPNPEQEGFFKHPISIQQIPPHIAPFLDLLQRGEITQAPISDNNGRWYIFKIASEETDAKAPPLAQVKKHIVDSIKARKANEQINHLLKKHGL